MSQLFRTCIIALTASSLCMAQIALPDGTKIACRLDQTISSATAEEGQRVQLVVTENVKVGDTIVIPQGAPAMGTIVEAEAKRRMGRTGKLDFSIEKVRAADGEYIPVRYTLQKREGGSKAVSTGVMTAGAAVLFWPAAPFFLLRKGKDVTINKGVVIEVFTDQVHTLKLANAAPANPGIIPAVPQVTGEAAIVSIVSETAGAEVEVNGSFVGSTPSTQKLTPGSHRIVVRNGKQVWERTLQVQPGASVTVHARFGT